jgi:dipeptidase E
MGTLYFLGGENVFRRTAKEINELAFQDAGGVPNVLVVSWARASFDVSFRRRKILLDYLRSLGAESGTFLDYSGSVEENIAKIAKSNLIYLAGGQPSILLERLKQKGIDRLLRSYTGVIVGRSAGALILGASFLATNRYPRKSKVVEGIGLVDFSVKVHYEPSQDVALEEFSRNGRVYAIPQSSALILKSGLLLAVGDVFLFDHGVKSRVSS